HRSPSPRQLLAGSVPGAAARQPGRRRHRHRRSGLAPSPPHRRRVAVVRERYPESMNVERVGPYLWRIPPEAQAGMRVPALIVADDVLMAHIRTEASLTQLANGATLPGIVKAAMAMPGIPQGYGLPVGGGVATDPADGGVSP